MSLATQRLIVPITARDKERVERRAAAGKISTAEYVRRAALTYELWRAGRCGQGGEP